MRDRLIELLVSCAESLDIRDDDLEEQIADYLLENGVIVPFYRGNQTVYVFDYGLGVWWEGKIVSLYLNEEDGIVYGINFKDGTFGTYSEKYVSATKEEAEQALGKLQANNRQVKEGVE